MTPEAPLHAVDDFHTGEDMIKPINGVTDQEIADVFTAALSKRERAPFDVNRVTILYWRTRKYQANFLLLEWILEKAQDPQAREWAEAFLAFLSEPVKVP